MSASGPAKRNFKLRVWRQKTGKAAGGFAEYEAREIPADASFLEMLDIVNEGLIARNEEPIAFDHDCREGICGMCSLVINGTPHGPNGATTTCQLYMRHFSDGQTIVVEPFRAAAFPVLRDLIVDRSALDRIQQAGGFISIRTGVGAGRELHPNPETRRGPGDGRRGLHSMRGVRCGLPECERDAIPRGACVALRTAAAGSAGANATGAEDDREARRGRVWKLPQPLRVRSRLPGGGVGAVHCKAQSGVRDGGGEESGGVRGGMGHSEFSRK